MIIVEAYIYPPGTAGLRLTYSRLGVGTLGGGVVLDSFTVGRDRLGRTGLGSAGAARTWVAMAGVTSVTASFGMTADNPAPVSDVGTLTLAFRNAGDPDMCPGLGPGAAVRLRDTTLGILWFGRLREATLATDKFSPDVSVTWTATDAVETLAGTQLDTAAAEGIVARAGRLASAAGLSASCTGAGTAYSGQTLGAITTADTIATHLDRTAASIRAMWWVQPAMTTSTVRVAWFPDGQAATATWSDTAPPSYTGIDQTWSYDAMVNTLDVTNVATGTKITISDPTSVATVGVRRRSLDLHLASDVAAQTVAAAYVLLGPGRAGRVSSIITGKPTTLPSLSSAWDITRRGRTYRCRLVGFRFHIVPDVQAADGEHWTVTHLLTERN